MSAGHVTLRRTDVGEGESLLEAAHRKLGEAKADVWAVDLSKDPVVFGVGMGPGELASLEIAPMTRADFPGLVAWQAMPHVARWWGQKSRNVDEAEIAYGGAVDGTSRMRMFVTVVNGRPTGFVQDYVVADYPKFQAVTATDAIGVDYAIGDPSLVGHGVGTRVVWTFLRDVVRTGHPEASTYFAAPDERNAASLRMLEKLGFTRGETFDELQPDGSSTTMVSCTLDVARVIGRPVTGE